MTTHRNIRIQYTNRNQLMSQRRGSNSDLFVTSEVLYQLSYSGKDWSVLSRWPSNWRPFPYHGNALPTELQRLVKTSSNHSTKNSTSKQFSYLSCFPFSRDTHQSLCDFQKATLLAHDISFLCIRKFPDERKFRAMRYDFLQGNHYRLKRL
jgi:hypothetical protein